jgi:hypothetical protein
MRRREAMAKSRIDRVTRREREIVSTIFALGNRASVEDIRSRLETPPSDSSVRVMLARLDAKGHRAPPPGGRAEHLLGHRVPRHGPADRAPALPADVLRRLPAADAGLARARGLLVRGRSRRAASGDRQGTPGKDQVDDRGPRECVSGCCVVWAVDRRQGHGGARAHARRGRSCAADPCLGSPSHVLSRLHRRCSSCPWRNGSCRPCTSRSRGPGRARGVHRPPTSRRRPRGERCHVVDCGGTDAGSALAADAAGMLTTLWMAGAVVFVLPLAVGHAGRCDGCCVSGHPWPEGQQRVKQLARAAGCSPPHRRRAARRNRRAGGLWHLPARHLVPDRRTWMA